MSTQHQTTTYSRIRQDGTADTQRDRVEAYLSRATWATTRMIATYMNIPEGRATARLSELMAQGRVWKGQTKAGRTAWHYEADTQRQQQRAQLYELERALRDVERAARHTELIGEATLHNLKWEREKLAGLVENVRPWLEAVEKAGA